MGKLSFMGAAERGRLEVVMQMMSEGIDINVTNSRGHNALRGAVRERHPHVVQYLLDHGADIDAESARGWTAAYIAARNGDQEMVRLLLSRGASVVKGASPLVAAVTAGSIGIVQALTEAGADVDAYDDTDCTALYRAVEQENEHLVDALLRAGANVHSRFTKKWFHPTAYDTVDETIMHVAARVGNARIIKLLLDHGCVPDACDREGNTPLELAFETGNLHVVGEFPNSPSMTADKWQPLFDKVVKDQDVPALEKLLLVADKQLIAGTLGRHLLAAVLCKKRCGRAMLALLLRAGVDVNAQDEEGRTLLHDAVFVGPKRIGRLIKRGADVNAKDHEGETPLHAAACRAADVTASLLDAGADIDVRDKDGFTPLHLAASGVADQVRSVGLDIVIQLGDSEPIEECIRSKSSRHSESERILRQLLERGAYVNALSREDDTPLDLAASDDIRDCLRNYGGRSGQGNETKT